MWVPALFLLPPTHLVCLADGSRKCTLIFVTPPAGGWQNKVTLSSQGLKVFITTLVLPHAHRPKSPYPPPPSPPCPPPANLRSHRLWVNPGHWFISLSGYLIHLLAHLFNRYVLSISYVSDSVLSTGNREVNKTDKIPVLMQLTTGGIHTANKIINFNI